MPSKNRTRHCVFTQNNWTADELRNLQSNLLSKASYYIFSEEVGRVKKTPHLQGYFQLTKQASISTIRKWWKKKIGRCCYVAAAFASSEDNIKYCTKIETSIGTVYEGGIKRHERGRRTDIIEYKNAIKDGMNDVSLLEEHTSCYFKYGRGRDEARRAYDRESDKKLLIDEMAGIELRQWQRKYVKLLLEQNDRQILWIWDNDGNIGKSTMSDWLEVNEDAKSYTNMEKRDFATALGTQNIVIFDLERSDEHKFDYSILKCLKDGKLAISKYESRMRRFTKKRVMVLANWPPNEHALSQDMWIIREIKKIK